MISALENSGEKNGQKICEYDNEDNDKSSSNLSFQSINLQETKTEEAAQMKRILSSGFICDDTTQQDCAIRESSFSSFEGFGFSALGTSEENGDYSLSSKKLRNMSTDYDISDDETQKMPSGNIYIPKHLISSVCEEEVEETSSTFSLNEQKSIFGQKHTVF
ncbi:uncharacterized protein LOC111086258 isoform X1 [Limulus polyphemus]|uniref:Uncharacterized protein LOC111086258 isoform X1 n=1 Tax=Limulus polyphemus TaxID=6850 RepID=A0ABM1SKH8_LIMPO|nr:uncharacterized protein LOC111086258 isoform X1 [Limulus polyphemus]